MQKLKDISKQLFTKKPKTVDLEKSINKIKRDCKEFEKDLGERLKKLKGDK